MITLLLTSVIRGLPSSDCSFAVAVDGGPAQPADTSIPGPASFTLPVGAQDIQIFATPTSADFWPVVGEFELQPAGTLDPTDVPVEFEPPRSVVVAGDGLISVITHLSRLRDCTDDCLATLATLPNNRTLGVNVPAEWPPASGGNPGGNWPPTAWDSPLHDVLSFVNDPSVNAAGIRTFQQSSDPASDDLVLELKNVDAPRTFAVSWPNDVSRALGEPPVPFLVYIHPDVTQNLPDFYTNGPYPFGFDFVYFGLWRYVNYLGDPLVTDPFAKGLPYQAAASGKEVVTVLPGNRTLAPGETAERELGVITDAGQLLDVLSEIQAFMFRRAGVYLPPGVGRVAMGSFSAGNGQLASFLAKPANRAHSFYLDTLRELYFFEPPNQPGGVATACVDQALAWAGRGTTGDKMIRCYTRGPVSNYATLVGGSLPPAPCLVASASGLRSAAILPDSGWRAAVVGADPSSSIAAPTDPDHDGQDCHQLVSALMLTDALRRSGF